MTDIKEENDVLAEIPAEPKWTDQSWDEYEQQLKEFKVIEARIAGHLEMLINNGYVEGIYVQRGADEYFSYGLADPRLTMSGYDLLDTVRSSPVWESIKSTAQAKGVELTFDVIKGLASLALKQITGGAM